jgi:hypothetical protein
VSRLGSAVRIAVIGALALTSTACGGDDGGSAAEVTTTTVEPRPVEEYRQDYLVLLTASECNASETDAIQDEIAPDGSVEVADFPVIQARLQPAWETRAEAIAAFQDGLANGDWSAELDPLVDAFISHLEEIRTVYRSGSTVDSFEAFGTLIFPADGTSQSDLHKELGLPAPKDLEGTEWCNGVPAL